MTFVEASHPVLEDLASLMTIDTKCRLQIGIGTEHVSLARLLETIEVGQMLVIDDGRTCVVVHKSRLLRVGPEPEPFDDIIELMISEIMLIINTLELFLEMIERTIDELLTLASIWIRFGVCWNHKSIMLTDTLGGKLLVAILSIFFSSFKSIVVTRPQLVLLYGVHSHTC